MELCAEIYRREWKTDTVQVNGRPGQGQSGVDVQGRPNDGPDWFGIQCKARSEQGARKAKLTEKEIRREVELARGFAPPLKHLIIATSAPHDQATQEIARQITEEHYAKGLFSVDVFGWAEIRRRMDRYSEVHDWYQSLGPIEHRLEKKLNALDFDLSAKLEEIKTAIGGGNTALAEALTAAQVDVARDLIRAHKPHAAIKILEALNSVVADKLTPTLRYRINSHLGHAYILLFNRKEAARFFLEAAQYKPEDDPAAAAQHAWGHLLLGELDTAEKIAQDGAARFPDSGRPQALLIAISHERKALADPAAAVPHAFCRDQHVAYTIASLYSQRDDLDQAAEWIKIGYAAAPEAWDQQKSYAEILLNRAISSTDFLFAGAATLRSDFEAARTELEKIWTVVRYGEPIAASAAIAAQVAVARKIAGDSVGARQAASAGMAMDDTVPFLLRISASLAEEDRHFDEAITYLKKINTQVLPDRDFVIASAQIEAGKVDDAVRTLETLAESAEAVPALRQTAKARSLEVRFSQKPDKSLIGEALALIEASPNVIVYRIAVASLYKGLKNEDEALAHAQVARDLSSGDCSVADQVMTAEILMDLGQVDSAVEIFERLAPDPVDSVIGRKLLRSLFESDRRTALSQRLAAMPENEKRDPFYLWIEAAFLERIGNLDAAAQLLARYLDINPEAAAARLNWISFLERLNRSHEVKAFVDNHFDLPKGTDLQRIKYAHILRRHGQLKKATELGYAIARRAPLNPEVHLAYMGLILSGSKFEEFDVQHVAPDQGFVLDLGEGVARRTYVIETAELLGDTHTLSPDHPIARAAIGKKSGDVIEAEFGPYSKIKGEIVEVRHKYLVLNDDLMNHFNERFPDHKGMFKISVPNKKEGVPDFSTFFRAIDDKADHDQSIAALYEKKHLPLPAIARLTGEHPIRAWGKLSAHGTAGIITCFGNRQEREQALSRLQPNDVGLIFDPITLNLIHELDIKDQMVALKRPLGVTRSAVESIEGLIEDMSLHGGGLKTIGKQGNQYVINEVSAEVITQHIEGLKGLVTWCRKHCGFVDAIGPADLPSEARRLGAVLDRSYMDTIQAARKGGWILVSDDLWYRGLAELADVKAVWLQAVLMYAGSNNLISAETYHDASVKLFLLNHNFTQLSSDTLVHAASQDHWRPTHRIKQLLDGTVRPNVEIDSAIRVLGGFFHKSFRPEIPQKTRSRIFKAGLDAFAQHHPEQVRRFHDLLNRAAAHAFKESNSAQNSRFRREWKQYIDEWLARFPKSQKSGN